MATEKRLIDADRLKKVFEDSLEGTYTITDPKTASVMAGTLIACGILIDEQPTVDAVEVVHGRWIGYHEADIGYDEYGVRCSSCNFEVEDHEVDFIMNYCPNCGAKMDGDGNGT